MTTEWKTMECGCLVAKSKEALVPCNTDKCIFEIADKALCNIEDEPTLMKCVSRNWEGKSLKTVFLK